MPYFIAAVVLFLIARYIWTALSEASWLIWPSMACVGVLIWVLMRWIGKETKRANEIEDAEIQKRIEQSDREREERKREEDALSDDFCGLVIGLVKTHAPVLVKKRAQCLYKDDYGNLCGRDQWVKELEYFRDNVVDVDQLILNLRSVARTLEVSKIELTPVDWLEEFIDKFLDDNFGSYGSYGEAEIDKLSGTEFEVHCAESLELDGWEVMRRGGSGDQGVDLIASVGQLRVAVQCKRYSQPVGNKAVQEVAAGRQYEQCDLAIVVSNADYTPAARQLASGLGVLLVHHTELMGLKERMESLFPALVSGEASA